MKIIKKEVNLLTGEEIIIEDDETAAETKERLEYEKQIASKQAEVQAKETARAEILAKLGLTEEEAAVLLG